jgi:hypothetical protein
MFNFSEWLARKKLLKDTAITQEREDIAYLKRVCGVGDDDPLPQAFSKIVQTLKRLRGETT